MKNTNTEIIKLEAILADRSMLQVAAVDHEKAIVAFANMDLLRVSYDEFFRQKVDLQNKTDLSSTRFETKKSNIVREINLLKEKIKILQNAQCIDMERAECAFLKMLRKPKEK